jgi:hypothetical protein
MARNGKTNGNGEQAPDSPFVVALKTDLIARKELLAQQISDLIAQQQALDLEFQRVDSALRTLTTSN